MLDASIKMAFKLFKANKPLKRELQVRKEILLAIEDITARTYRDRANKALLDEKNLIRKEVHHRIKNSMNTLRSLLQLHADSLTEPSAIEALLDADGRVLSMMMLYDKLYRSVDYGELSIKEYLGSLTDEILANFPNVGSIRVEKKFDDFQLAARAMQSIGIIVNELLTNVMKYAFKGRASGVIRISTSLKEGVARIAVADDGAGVPENVNFDNTPGFGLMLVRTLSEQLGGSITLARDGGTIITLTFRP